MTERVVARLNSLAVHAYKAFGFLVLVAILGGLLSYLSVQGFFLLSHRWVTPTILSPTDERVLHLNVQLVEQNAARDRLGGERAHLRARLEEAERTLAQQTLFQKRFRAALQQEHSVRARELN